jgi:hypothetical protein
MMPRSSPRAQDDGALRIEPQSQHSDGEKFNLTATEAVLYFDSFARGQTVSLRFRLRAKYPVRARTFKSRVTESV